MVLRIILGFCGGSSVSESHDALGWLQDGRKDHPGILWWMRREFVLGCSRMDGGWRRMVLRIILGFLGGCGMSKFQDGSKMVLRIILGFCGRCGVSESQDAPGWVKMAQDGHPYHPRILTLHSA